MNTTNISIDCTATMPSVGDLDAHLRNAIQHANKHIARFHQVITPVACAIPILIVGIAIYPPAKYLFAAMLPICLAILVWLVFFQRSHRRVKLIYTLNESSEQIRLGLLQTVKALLPSSYAKIVEDWTPIKRKKVESNSSHSIRTYPFKVGHGKSLPWVISNLALPWIAGRTQTYLFSLHHLFVLSKWQVQAFRYSDLDITVRSGLMTMNSAPRNARVVDRPWQYINQDGTRDRRFKDNFQAYTFETTELFIKNQSEQMLHLMSVRYGSVDDFVGAMSALKSKLFAGHRTVPPRKATRESDPSPFLSGVTAPLPNPPQKTPSRYLAGVAQYEGSRDRVYFNRVDVADDRLIIDVATDWGAFGLWSIDRLTLLLEGEDFVARRFQTQKAGQHSDLCTLTLTATPIGSSLAIRGRWAELDESYEFSGILEIQG